MIEIDAFVNTSVCRCCMSRGTFKQLREKYNWMGQDEIYANMLRDCFNITLSTNEIDDSDGICELCIAQLRNALNFKNQVKEADKQFRASSINFKKDRSVKVEILNKEEDDFHNLDDFIDESEEYKVTIEPELVETKPKLFEKRKRKTKPCSSKLKRVENPENFDDLAETSRTGLSQVSDKKKLLEKKKYKDNFISILQYSNATPFIDWTTLGYSCLYCKNRFINPEELRAHTKLHDNDKYKFISKCTLRGFTLKLDVTALRCLICDTNIENLNDLKKHLSLAHNKIIYDDVQDLIVPFKLVQGRIFNCALCSYSYDNFKMLMQHMNTHYDNFQCCVCYIGFATLVAMKKHEKRHKEGSFSCQYCEKVFPSNIKRNYHERGVHTESWAKIKCPYCLEKFTDYHNRNKHLHAVHGIAPMTYKCSACSKVFPKKSLITAHQKKYHLMEKRYRCPFCEVEFFRKFDMTQHAVKHTREKNFTCDLCRKNYSRKKSLRAHMMMHINRRYRCGLCDERCAKKIDLTNHIKMLHS